MKKILIYGAGGHCLSLVNLIETNKKFKIIGIIGRREELNKKILSYKIKYTDEDLNKLSKICNNITISITHFKNLKKRDNLFNFLRDKFNIPNIISPFSRISKHFKIGDGNQIFHDVLINSGVQINNNCIVNNKSLIEHNSILENNVHISTGVIVNGDCKIEKNSFIGSGSILKQGTFIRKNKFIKMGSLIAN